MTDRSFPGEKRIFAVTDTGTTSKSANWEIHRHRCHHIRKGLRQTITTAKAYTPERVADWFVDDELQEMGWNVDDVQIMACSRAGR